MKGENVREMAMKNSPPGDPAGTENSLLEFSQSCVSLFESWCLLWQSALPTKSNTLLEAGLQRMADPGSWLATGWNEFDRQLQHLIDRPVFADLWEIDRDLLKALSLWFELRRVGSEHQVLVWNAWTQARLRFSQALTERMAGEGGQTKWRELTTLWTDIANRTLLEAHRSDAFLDAQRRMLEIALRYRAQESELVEKISSRLNMPTRSELDEVHRSIHELKR